ncbi:predicted protein [Arabidopsis lyrata subsp. lyrata]|uniref:Predicted protein n=1 Tax=Arabidopsis lyrata subsp. lyrata TaxID=81972 RepID=D7LMA2_ARALL|nr:predicted protein [Arabidopsis lyrata subsp. lyrata]
MAKFSYNSAILSPVILCRSSPRIVKNLDLLRVIIVNFISKFCFHSLAVVVFFFFILFDGACSTHSRTHGLSSAFWSGILSYLG